MTSQVAVMNLKGIAVASDTVVSLKRDSATKTMGNTAKIYEIGPAHKVLVMHSGSTDMNDVPLSLFVSEWSKTTPTPLATLQDYVDAFIKWASRESVIHVKDSEVGLMSTVLREHFSWVATNARNAVSNEVQGEKETQKAFQKRLQALTAEQVVRGNKFLDGLQGFKGLSESAASQALRDADYDLDNWISYHFGDTPLSQESIDGMKLAAAKALTKFQSLDSDATLAFVGFGADESFGGSITLTIRGIYAGALRVAIEERFGVASDDKSGIHHFAQGDAIATFLRGYNWKIFKKFTSEYREKVFENFSPNFESSKWDEIESQIADTIKSFSHDEFISPMLSTIEAMSLESLAEFAESLVALQATATYAEAGPATVGGLIEVATIDRTSGIRWVKALAYRPRSS